MSTINIDKEELNEYLSLFQDKLVSNLEIITNNEAKIPFYHISTKRYTELVPNVSRRAALSEDNTMPRVYVSPYLAGCIASVENIGYTAINYKSGDKSLKKNKAETPYKGGYYIHMVTPRVALKPNKKLVYDVKLTDEHWLVPYSPMYKTYETRVIGKLFVKSISFIPVTGKFPLESIDYCLEVQKPGLWINNKVYLPQGNWILTMVDSVYKSHRLITAEDYKQSKTMSADLLSYVESFRVSDSFLKSSW